MASVLTVLNLRNSVFQGYNSEHFDLLWDSARFDVNQQLVLSTLTDEIVIGIVSPWRAFSKAAPARARSLPVNS